MLNRVVRVGRFVKLENTLALDLLPPLHDVLLLSAKPSQWSLTGWEQVDVGVDPEPRAFQQSWILVPCDYCSE